MEPDHWQRLQRLFCEAADLEAERQAALLAAACADDADLRAQIDALLDADASGSADDRIRAAIAAAAEGLTMPPKRTGERPSTTRYPEPGVRSWPRGRPASGARCIQVSP